MTPESKGKQSTPGRSDAQLLRDMARSERRSWSPVAAIGRTGATALITGALLGALWAILAWHNPEATICQKHDDGKVTLFMVIFNGLVGFVASWILFAIVHHVGQTIGGLATAWVALGLLLVVLVKQAALAISGQTTEYVDAAGWGWLSPMTILLTNYGAFFGLGLAVYLFREGDSFIELFHS